VCPKEYFKGWSEKLSTYINLEERKEK
jgi:hypothetical protein